MKVVLSPSQMRAYDRYAIETMGIPGAILMENAGANAAREILARFGPMRGKPVFVFCGKGNNGGDGFVVARHLITAGARVYTFLLARRRELQGDALQNFSILHAFLKGQESAGLTIELASISDLRKYPKPDLVIDAIYGTGFAGSLTGLHKKAVSWINSTGVPVVSIDIPSGLNGTTGEASVPSVCATMTVTMAFLKTGLLVGNGPDFAGTIAAVSIGAPAQVPHTIPTDTFAVESQDIGPLLPARERRTHKYSLGKTLIIAGARGMTGAAAMSARAALRVGGGMVSLCTPRSSYGVLASALTEIMVMPVEETTDGTFALGALDVLRDKLSWADVLVLGPGLSRNRETQELIQTITKECDKPTVLDADGLNAVDVKFLGRLMKGKQLILTPHAAELSRLVGISSKAIEADRIAAVRQAAQAADATVILKGAPTVISDPSGMVYINSTGNPILATPGSGDILSGVIGGLLAQHLDPVEAAYSGVFVHGAAADAVAQKFGDRGMFATDLIGEIPLVVKTLRNLHGN